jgi:hypothetical protein
MARFDHGWGKDFAAGIGGEAEAIEREDQIPFATASSAAVGEWISRMLPILPPREQGRQATAAPRRSVRSTVSRQSQAALPHVRHCDRVA